MCGIVGYFGSKDVDLTLAAKSILHRGPDMQGISGGRGWKIAFNRLSIIDISERGMQPFSYAGVSVVMNGEIYNYRELKEEHKSEFTCRSESDVEIVPFLYKKYGLGFLQKLNGMFAMAIMDPAANRYLLVRDRYGKKPLFYRHTDGGVYFASELKALKQIVPLRPDKTNLALNMACWLLIQPLTPYENVFNVKPGHYLEFNGAVLAQRQWYQPAIDSGEQTYAEIRDRFLSLYRQSINLRLRSDVPVGISLSGGLDSSSMAYLARDVSPENFVAFTASITGKERWEGSTDTENPGRLCKDLGIRQVSSVVDFDFWNRNIVDIARNYDQIFLNSGTLIFYAISAAAQANGVKVLLSGVGGDELWGGYPWQAQMRSLPIEHLRSRMRTTSSASSKRIHELWSRLGPGTLRSRVGRAYRLFSQFHVWHAQSLCGVFVPAMRDMDRSIAERIESLSGDYFRVAMQAVRGDTYNQVQYANIFTVIGDQNYQLDMASMRHSVENRSPMLDVKVVEYLMSVPDHLKNQSGPKSLMRQILAEFLPGYITRAGKSGPTMPLNQWYENNQFRTRVRAFLIDHRPVIAELASADLAGRLHDERLYTGQVGVLRTFALLSLVIWAKLNVEETIPDSTISFSELAGWGGERREGLRRYA
jgi:asparagine synthase (glutamine-hydrolysing)